MLIPEHAVLYLWLAVSRGKEITVNKTQGWEKT